MLNLTTEQLKSLDDFVKEYIQAENAAIGSRYDANANVINKNVITLIGEMVKPLFIQYNRYTRYQQMVKDFGIELADEYIKDIENARIYQHDESHYLPYCLSISLFPFLQNGSKCIGGITERPKHLSSFCGGLINLMNQVAAQVAGAVAIPSLLVCFDFFSRKDYGENYLETHENEIKQELQHLIYYLNEPCSGRSGQCVRADTTQLWTPSGFKYLHELKVGDECYVWKNGKYEIEKIKKLNIYDYNDELLQFSGKNYQQTVTPNHRIVYKKDNIDIIEITEAHNMFGHSKISMPVCANIDREDYPISDDLLILSTYALTYGNIEVLNDYTHYNAMSALTYYVSKNRKSYQAIINSLNTLQITYSIKSVKKSIGNYDDVVAISLTPTQSKEILSIINNTKKQVPDLFLKLSSRQANIIIKHWSMSGGQELKTTPRLLQCDNHEIADKVQQICLLGGMGSSIIERQGIDPKKTIYVYIFSQKFKRVSEYNKVFYHGKVWCPTTDAGVVIFREENKTPYISGNSIFWNVSIFDKLYLEGMYGNFVYPADSSKVNIDSVMKLQKFFLTWFNKEREKSLLTFPVITCAMVYDKQKQVIDKEFKKMVCEELSQGNGFFVYLSDSVDSLSSCCRLRNETKNEFSFTLGNVGEMTGSVNVITINMNRFIQDTHRIAQQTNVNFSKLLISELRKMVQKIHKYHVSIRKILTFMRDSNMYPVHSAHFIEMERQFSTIGINGLVEAAEYLGYDITPNDQYMNFCATILKTISAENKAANELYGIRFNTEFVPGENAGHKLAQWDKRDGYVVPRECYNSYFYRVEDDGLSVIEKANMHGKLVTKYLDGGSAVHYNMDSYMTAEQYSKWIDVNAYVGVNYFCTNILITCCEEENCGYINKNTEYHCVKCGSKNVSHATRVIGFLKKIKNFSKARQEEAALRFYHKDKV